LKYKGNIDCWAMTSIQHLDKTAVDVGSTNNTPMLYQKLTLGSLTLYYNIKLKILSQCCTKQWFLSGYI